MTGRNTAINRVSICCWDHLIHSSSVRILGLYVFGAGLSIVDYSLSQMGTSPSLGYAYSGTSFILISAIDSTNSLCIFGFFWSTNYFSFSSFFWSTNTLSFSSFFWSTNTWSFSSFFWSTNSVFASSFFELADNASSGVYKLETILWMRLLYDLKSSSSVYTFWADCYVSFPVLTASTNFVYDWLCHWCRSVAKRITDIANSLHIFDFRLGAPIIFIPIL